MPERYSPSMAFLMSYKDDFYQFIMDKISPGLTVLDIGCKDGKDILYLSDKKEGVNFLGLDINFLESWMKDKRIGINFIQAQACSLPVRCGSVDIVIASELIEHLKEVDKFLTEVLRVLKPQGYLFLTTPFRYNYPTLIGKIIPQRFKSRLRKLVYHRQSERSGILEMLPDGKIIKEHVYEYIPAELKRLLIRNGFDVYRVQAGRLHVPVCPLYDRAPFLLGVWRFLDRIIGNIPFLRAIKANFIVVARKREIGLNRIKNILVVNLGGIGDILLSGPALRAIKNKFPKTEISILIFKPVSEALKATGYIDRIFLFSRSPFSFLNNLFILLRLRKMNFDLLVNMRTIVSRISALKIKVLLSIIRPKITAGRDTHGLAGFLDLRIHETLIGQKSEMEYDIDTVKALGACVTDRNIDFPISKQSMDKIEKILENNGVNKAELIIGVHPGGESSRRWPVENFVQTLGDIAKNIHCKFIITGVSSEFRLAERVRRRTGAQAINLAGKITVEELAALIKKCRLYISNDTGPMHIAAVLKTPLLAIFGPGDIKRYDPRNIFPEAVVLHKNNADCAPCNKMSCRSMRCLKSIESQEVTAAALSLLKAR